MGTFLVTGGAGFFGELLKNRLLEKAHTCVSIDLEYDTTEHPRLVAVQGDIRDISTLRGIFLRYRFDAVFHCAAILAHAVKDKTHLWTSNVDGTRNVAECAREFHVPRVVFTSSNCLWGQAFRRPVTEDDPPRPVEIYGRSKWEGERILLAHRDSFQVVIIRCPTIMDCGRLGLLAILFEFIDEGRKVWMVGGGRNRYQFIYAQDLIDACLRALRHEGSGIFNIGADNVRPFREVYQYVVDKAGTGARLASLPRRPTLLAMRLAYHLGVSPLGPYQYRMIAEDFLFDTHRIKQTLGWRPTLTNEEMLYRAFEYYRQHKDEIRQRTDVAAHKRAARMGVIRLLKWLS